MRSTSYNFVMRSLNKPLAMSLAEFAYKGRGVYAEGNAPHFLALVEAFAVDSVDFEGVNTSYGDVRRVSTRVFIFHLTDNSYLEVGIIPAVAALTGAVSVAKEEFDRHSRKKEPSYGNG